MRLRASLLALAGFTFAGCSEDSFPLDMPETHCERLEIPASRIDALNGDDAISLDELVRRWAEGRKTAPSMLWAQEEETVGVEVAGLSCPRAWELVSGAFDLEATPVAECSSCTWLAAP